MFRLPPATPASGRSIPHPSGDVPIYRPGDDLYASYSPPKWGCSAGGADEGGAFDLFPTQVGMFRLRDRDFAILMTIPHPSGDVPLMADWSKAKNCYSPPKWGCSDTHARPPWIFFLFPTQVGMFRCLCRFAG